MKLILPSPSSIESSSFTNINNNSMRILEYSQNSTVESLREKNYELNFQRRVNCNLQTPNNCHIINKSLVISFWGEKSGKKWIALNFLKIFPEKSFDYIIMIYDNSTWNNHPIYEKAIWIYVKNQIRYWYIKRFLPPYIIQAYRYIWIVDDDARFDFNTQAYECVINQFNILLSAPARLTGPISYLFTRISPHYTSKIGRWTDFVETGPLVIANSSAFACLWNYISEKVSLGYGLDLIWCKILSTQCNFQENPVLKTCAILDTFAVDHDAVEVSTIDFGSAELPAYNKYYQNYKTKRQIFGAIATDSSIFDICAEKYSTNQSFIL
ncbi:unnamed protein product [Adineta steineri]|uniref:Uncharacterized protein n=1 Tax=Adineta steineri TaxID=433720 RepID=A0A814F4J7_9BILA|nr:unnamed protein product [Adineta steineri]